MISVILHSNENEAPKLARTLENLVSLAVDGFVQEVIVTHDGLDNATQILADEAGCNLVQLPIDLKKICASARGDWLLFIEAGATLQSGWAEVVSAHASADGGAASFKLTISSDVPWWKRLFAPTTYKSPLAKGFLISKRQARANVSDKAAPVDLMRGLAMKRLSAGIVPG